MDDDDDRRVRARARSEVVVLRKTTLGAREPELFEVRGAAGVSLVRRLTQEGWALSGAPWPEYSRSETPYRFVPRDRPR